MSDVNVEISILLQDLLSHFMFVDLCGVGSMPINASLFAPCY